MENKFDLISIGDASFDVFLRPQESTAGCEIDSKRCVICFPYAKKVAVKNLVTSLGGNAANNAVGAARLGVKTTIVLTLGQDNSGDQIVENLKSESVDMTYVIQQPATNSNYSAIIDYQGERTMFVYHAPRSYEFPVELPKASWIYLTSMGESFRPFYNHLADWLKANPEVKVAFNPGTWQFVLGTESIKEILSLTQMIYLNREEAEGLAGMGNSQGKEKELLGRLGTLGPKTCLVTDGPNGSYFSDRQRYLKCGILPVDVYQRTGAGDAFGSGCLSALIKGKSLDEAMLWGTANSASVVGYVGAQKGLLREAEMSEWLERCKSSDVKVNEF